MTNGVSNRQYRQARSRRASPLRWFVSLSLLLHAALLWHWQRTPIVAAAPATAGMSVQLLERPHAAVAAERPPAPLTTAAPSPPVQQASGPKAPANSESEKRPPAAETEPGQRPATPPAGLAAAGSGAAEAIDETALESRLRVTLQQALARHFSYPLLARRRGWQGEVLLAFRLQSDGRIIDARVARSSGYGVLDRAALDALGKVGRISPGTEYGFAMQLPVIYRLEG
ncbi:MAG TPA: TonB family protein [Gammaproteobacteria bacterium]